MYFAALGRNALFWLIQRLHLFLPGSRKINQPPVCHLCTKLLNITVRGVGGEQDEEDPDGSTHGDLSHQQHRFIRADHPCLLVQYSVLLLRSFFSWLSAVCILTLSLTPFLSVLITCGNNHLWQEVLCNNN